MINYEKWLWIELIGFDNQKEDLGVAEFISKLGFIPHGISLLLWNPDFIHSHSGLLEDDFLGEPQCAYGARPRNEDRDRQFWTKFQLRELVKKLKDQGIETYFSVFDQLMSKAGCDRWNIPKRSEWIDEHKELFFVTKDAKTVPNICPLKRLKNDTLYEDYFIKNLCQVLNDYGFDGFHGADGYAHPRIPISNGDFSDDMIEQFIESENITVPSGTTEEKAAWILHNTRKEWGAFHTKRHQQFWRKTIEALRVINRKLIFNTAWTRDPFEAKYRYGVDYKMLADIGVDKFIVEAPAAVVELEGWNKTPYSTLDKFMSMIMRIKAYVPHCNLILLNCIKDGMEQYNVLRHAPSMLESDVFSMANVFKSDAADKIEKCLSGIMACLADGISQSEWSFIRKTWETGFSSQAKSFSGATVIWSDKAFANEYDNYASTSLCNSHQMHYKLLSSGAPLVNICNIDALESLSGCLLVIHPVFLPKNELQTIFNYHNGPVIFVGMGQDNDFSLTVYNDGKMIQKNSAVLLPASNEPEPVSWLNELPAKEPANDFFEETAQIIKQYTQTAELLDDKTLIKLWEIKTGSFVKRIFIRNDSHRYTSAEIDVKADIKTVVSVTDYPTLPVPFKENILRLKISPGGLAVLDIKTR